MASALPILAACHADEELERADGGPIVRIELADGTVDARGSAQMNENPVQRSLIGISAAAAAEHFRDEENKDILFFADNMFRYIQARNELSTILDQVPNEGGYEPTVALSGSGSEDILLKAMRKLLKAEGKK